MHAVDINGQVVFLYHLQFSPCNFQILHCLINLCYLTLFCDFYYDMDVLNDALT